MYLLLAGLAVFGFALRLVAAKVKGTPGPAKVVVPSLAIIGAATPFHPFIASIIHS
jgi:hypothetical protein